VMSASVRTSSPSSGKSASGSGRTSVSGTWGVGSSGQVSPRRPGALQHRCRLRIQQPRGPCPVQERLLRRSERDPWLRSSTADRGMD
jgi:hypothetical protein